MKKRRSSRLDPYFTEIKTLRSKGLSTATITILMNEKLERKMKYHSVRRFMEINKILELGRELSHKIY